MARTSFVLAVYLSSLFLSPLCASAYTWPNPQYDALETLLYEGRRSDGSSLSDLVHPCRKRAGTLASVAAEWLRFAFHDMATHNVDDGTGGLDGSIVYELDRTENFGLGFNQTENDFEIYPNKYVSRADVISIGAIFGVASCGGPVIPFRGGRIDAWAGGGTGTPEPQQDLPTLMESFRKQGFNQAEMIKLVACGHSVGGVRSSDFPQLVPPNPDSLTPVIDDFDSTPQFDNAVVTEYLGGRSQNKLIISSNATMNSDLRVFEADSNQTISTLADPSTYQSECQSILARMIDVVPTSVNLTDEITLLPAKVNGAQLTFEKNKLVFKATFRLVQASNSTLPANRTVTMLFCDKYGDGAGCKGSKSTNSALPVKTLQGTNNVSPLLAPLGVYFMNYDFVVPISGSTSIGKFWFEVDDTPNGGKKVEYNNGGSGYVFSEDSVFLVPMMSHMDMVSNATFDKTYTNRDGEAFTQVYQFVAAARQDIKASRVWAEGTDVTVKRFPFPVYPTQDFTLNSTYPALEGYDFYTATVSSAGRQLSLDVKATGTGSQTFTQTFAQTLQLDNTFYVAPGNSTKSGEKLDAGAVLSRNGMGVGLVPVVVGTVVVLLSSWVW